MSKYRVKIQHKVFGTLLDDGYVNQTQFKLFLKMVHGCFQEKVDLTCFNGLDFYLHIPYEHLRESIITTSSDSYDISSHFRSKMESKVN